MIHYTIKRWKEEDSDGNIVRKGNGDIAVWCDHCDYTTDEPDGTIDKPDGGFKYKKGVNGVVEHPPTALKNADQIMANLTDAQVDQAKDDILLGRMEMVDVKDTSIVN